jgi:hypothetical protein
MCSEDARKVLVEECLPLQPIGGPRTGVYIHNQKGPKRFSYCTSLGQVGYVCDGEGIVHTYDDAWSSGANIVVGFIVWYTQGSVTSCSNRISVSCNRMKDSNIVKRVADSVPLILSVAIVRV